MPPRSKRAVSSGSDTGDVKPSVPPSASKPKSKASKREREGSSEPKAKKPRASVDGESSAAGGGKAEVEVNDDGESFFKLSEYRRVTVRTFKGKTLIDIRDTYKDKATGAMKPGAKGISLTPEQWEVLKANVGSVDSLVEKIGKK
ncbi:hypothetical protein IAT38_004337 [Cryptococcus sp. DSM 104549]